MNLTLESIQLTSTDLSDYSVYLSSSQELYSPTAPAKPKALFGWRDRWWLDNKPSHQIAIHYWFFETADEAYTAADQGRFRLTAKTMLKIGGHQSSYQTVDEDQLKPADTVWQAGANWLFIKDKIAILVAEIGGQITEKTTLEIALKILTKIENAS